MLQLRVVDGREIVVDAPVLNAVDPAHEILSKACDNVSLVDCLTSRTDFDWKAILLVQKKVRQLSWKCHMRTSLHTARFVMPEKRNLIEKERAVLWDYMQT